MFIIALPIAIITEIIYLIRHPWTFNWTATIVWATITGIGFLLFRSEKTIGFSPFVFCGAFFAYYSLKINLNRRRPEVMKRHREHYYSHSGTHHHKQWTRYPKKGGIHPTKGPRRYRTVKEIDNIIKKITSK
jgi:hypothetical protein